MAAPLGNQYALGNNGGKPRKFKTPKVMEEAIAEYFNSCYQERVERDKNGDPIYNDEGKVMTYMENIQPITITGLAVALGTNRQTLLTYQNEYKKEFHDTITRAKSIIESYAENNLFTAKSTNGVIFSLKNNYGWHDKQEVDVNADLDGVINVRFISHEE